MFTVWPTMRLRSSIAASTGEASSSVIVTVVVAVPSAKPGGSVLPWASAMVTSIVSADSSRSSSVSGITMSCVVSDAPKVTDVAASLS